MKNKKVMSLVLAALLPFTSMIENASAKSIETTEISDLVAEESTKKEITNAEKYFGWDPNFLCEYGSVTVLRLLVDKKVYILPVTTKNITYSDYRFVDIYTGEKIFDGRADSKKVRFYDYFDEDQEVIFDGFTDLRPYIKYTGQDMVSLGEIADSLSNNKPHFDESNYYSEINFPNLDNLEYNNTIPSKNDELLIEKKDLFILASVSLENLNYRSKFIFLKTISRKNKRDEVFADLFTDEKTCELTNNEFIFYENSFSISDKEYMQIALGIEHYKPEFYSYLKQSIEVIDGVEYYNVGKLRKVYENIDLESRYDYSHKLEMKPASKELNLEHEKGYLYPIAKAKKKELTIES